MSIRESDIGRDISELRNYFNINNRLSLASIREDKPPIDMKNILNRLYKELLGGLKLPANVSRLIIVPDQCLYGLPWSALMISDSEALIDEYEIDIVPSCNYVLSRPRQIESDLVPKEDSRDKLLLVGALSNIIGFNLTSTSNNWTQDSASLPTLRNGWEECLSIAKSLPGYEIEYLMDHSTLMKYGSAIKGDIASPRRVLESMGSATIAHIVAHGVFDNKFPMNSAIFLEPDSLGSVLFANAFADRDLDNLQFVCISACQSGISDVLPGDEPLGFVRGLLGAGVHSIMLFEWEVDDLATSRLLSVFYRQYSGNARSKALRIAQLELRRTFEHPYFWAGFTLYGEWD